MARVFDENEKRRISVARAYLEQSEHLSTRIAVRLKELAEYAALVDAVKAGFESVPHSTDIERQHAESVAESKKLIERLKNEVREMIELAGTIGALINKVDDQIIHAVLEATYIGGLKQDQIAGALHLVVRSVQEYLYMGLLLIYDQLPASAQIVDETAEAVIEKPQAEPVIGDTQPVKRYLRQSKTGKSEIKRTLRKIEALRSHTTNITTSYSDMPHSPHTKHDFTDYLVENSELYDKLSEDLRDLTMVMSVSHEAVSALTTPIEKYVFEQTYFIHMRQCEISTATKLTDRHVRRLQDNVCRKVSRLVMPHITEDLKEVSA